MGVTTRVAALGLAVLALGGCAYQRWREPASGEVVRCGQVPIWPWYAAERASMEVYEEATCMVTREAQGYKRVASPPYFHFFKHSAPLY